MSLEIRESVEEARGCGYRKEGGLYLVGGKLANACGKLPIPLTICPCCGQGIKQARGVSWISGEILANSLCRDPLGKLAPTDECSHCEPFRSATKESRFMLMWVGEKYYPTPADFAAEGWAQGISKRIHQVPKDLVVGETWMLLAHPKACVEWSDGEQGERIATYTPGIFQAFIPQRIEYVVRGDETPEELESKVKRGISLVRVIPDKPQPKPEPHAKKAKKTNQLPLETTTDTGPQAN